MIVTVSEEVRINVRTTSQIKQDLEITARLKGLTVSALVNSLVVKAIREEKQAEPSAFPSTQKVQDLGNVLFSRHLAKSAPTKIKDKTNTQDIKITKGKRKAQ